MEKKNYIFAGWYTDSRFTDGTQYVPDIYSRISGNMELYAKWEPNQFTARFYLYTDDESVPYREEGFAEGGRITDWTVPPAVQDIFLGWYWYQDGRLQPFDFTSAVAKTMWTRMESSSFMPDGMARKVRSAIFPVQAEITVHRRSLSDENMRLMRPASCCLLTILSGKIILYLQTRV